MCVCVHVCVFDANIGLSQVAEVTPVRFSPLHCWHSVSPPPGCPSRSDVPSPEARPWRR